MTTAYTSLLGLALPVTGELSGTWGDTVNNSITSLLDSAIAGTTTLSTDADVTLTTTTGAANTSRQAILLCSGARTVLRTITAPAQSKIYTIINATTGGFSVKLVGVGPTTGVTIVAGESAVCAWNGSDFIKISNTAGVGTFTNLTVTGTLGVTGVATLGNGAILGTPASGTVTNLTGTASININGTVGATTATTGAFTTLSATGVTTVQAGTAALPAITTTGDTNTGIFFPAADTIAFTEGGAEAARIDSSGNLLISTITSPSSPGISLGATGTVRQLLGGMLNTSWRIREGVNVDYAVLSTNINDGGTQDNAAKSSWKMGMGYGNVIDNWAIYRAPAGSSSFTQAMTLFASGSLALGTTSDPTGGHFAIGPDSAKTAASLMWLANTGGRLYVGKESSAGGTIINGTDAYAAVIATNNAYPLQFGTNNAVRATIDSSGNLLVGTTSSLGGLGARVDIDSGTSRGMVQNITSTSPGRYQEYLYTGSTVGSISTNGTITVYNTTSDHRLKNNQEALTGSGAFIDALQPKTWNWAQDGSKGAGFIAHEFAEVSPSSVNGEKDAVDAKGNPIYQSMQASSAEVIANLVAEIQSLRKRLAAAGI